MLTASSLCGIRSRMEQTVCIRQQEWKNAASKKTLQRNGVEMKRISPIHKELREKEMTWHTHSRAGQKVADIRSSKRYVHRCTDTLQWKVCHASHAHARALCHTRTSHANACIGSHAHLRTVSIAHGNCHTRAHAQQEETETHAHVRKYTKTLSL